MAFDSETLPCDLINNQARRDTASLIADAIDPALSMADADPARLLAYLFVSPRPCAALDALIERAAA